MKLNKNFFFRKRIIKNKLIKLLRANKIIKKPKFKRFKFKKNIKRRKFKKLFNKKTWKLFNRFVRKTLKKRFKNKKRLKIFFKKKSYNIKKRSLIISKTLLNRGSIFSFKWKNTPNLNLFNQKTLTNFIVIFSEKNDIQTYNLNLNITYNLPYIYFFKLVDTWLTLNSTFFKNYLTIYNQIFLNNNIVYKNNFFTSNKTLLINLKELSYLDDNDFNISLKPVKNFSKLLNLIVKQLPYIELVRSFRVNAKRKVLSYDIDIMEFFKSNLLRVNQDSKNYKLNIIKYNKVFKIFRVLGLLKLSNFNKSDNVFESIFDTNLSKLTSIRNFKKKMLLNNVTDNKKLIKSNSSKFTNILDNNLILTRNTDLLFTFFENTTLYKYLNFNNNLSYFNYNKTINKNNNLSVVNDLNKHFFNSRVNIFNKSNLISSNIFKYTIKRKLLKIVNFHKFSSNIIMWYYNILIRFMENCSGKKVYLKFNPFIENSLSFTDIARCNMWSSRITSFQRLLGPKIFLKESLKILHIAIKFKDPTFLSNWIKGMLYRMSFWKYRLLFRYLKYTMRYLFWLYFPELEFKGFKLRLKGKISVAGNARTRTLMYRIGETSYSKLNNRIVSDFTTINTFTGVLGFKIWFFF
jgi:hypothetical protein